MVFESLNLYRDYLINKSLSRNIILLLILKLNKVYFIGPSSNGPFCNLTGGRDNYIKICYFSSGNEYI